MLTVVKIYIYAYPFYMKKQRKNVTKNKGFYNKKQGPTKKKAFGQHFLRRQSVVDHMIAQVTVTPETAVIEIGCGDGFLTQSILTQTNCTKLWIVEIDPAWAAVVKEKLPNPRLTVHVADILTFDWNQLAPHQPWVMLANLPFQITFPILFKLKKYRHFFQEGVVMIQEEVAQKIVATRGKKYSPTSLRLQHVFDFKLLEKIDPSAFSPPPKVHSRLVYFKPIKNPVPIPDEENFRKFIKLCFRFPRQTLRNNMKGTHYDVTHFSKELLQLRAQQLSFEQLLNLWEEIRK